MKRCFPALILFGFALIGPAEAAPSCPPGFAALQSGDTCVRISGRVRGDAVIRSPRSRVSDSYGTHASGRVQLDVRKRTEYGPLRAVVRVGGRTR